LRTSVEVDSKDFMRGMERTIQRMHEGADRETSRLGFSAASRMTSTVAVKTGETKGTIRVKRGRDSSGAFAELTASGAATALEFGTRYMRSQPFFRGAVNEAVQDLRSIL
jgi:HK97 gp10 family phage protein